MHAQRLTARFFQAMLLLPVVSLGAAGCVGGTDPNAYLGSPGGPGEACFAWPMVIGTGGQGGAGGMGGGSGVGGAPGTGAGGNGSSGGLTECPSEEQASKILVEGASGCGVNSIDSGPTYKPIEKKCCYQATYGYCSGRPYLVDDEPRTAPLRTGSAGGWSEGDATRIDALDLELDPAIRAQIAEAWARDGLAEHASIPSFGRFALELLAVGAPADLVADAHAAALDEVRHARLCFGLASAYSGAPVEPGRFPFGGPVEIETDLARIAARVAREGCIDETAAALQVAEQLLGAQDPAVRAALTIIAEDEARHAELAWRTVAWALRTGGASVRAAIAEVFAGLTEVVPPTRNEREHPALAAHGRLSAWRREAVAIHARTHVIEPSARALLEATPQSERLTRSAA